MERRRLHGRTDVGLRKIRADRTPKEARSVWWMIPEAETDGGRVVSQVLAPPTHPAPSSLNIQELET